MTIIATNLGVTRERAKQLRYEQTSNTDSTNVQDAINEIDNFLHVSVGGPLRIVTAAGAVTVSATEAGVAINKTVGGATVVNLPLAADRGGLDLIVKDMKGDSDVNNITVTPDAADVNGIDGNATDVLAIPKASQRYRPTSNGWLRI